MYQLFAGSNGDITQMLVQRCLMVNVPESVIEPAYHILVSHKSFT